MERIAKKHQDKMEETAMYKCAIGSIFFFFLQIVFPAAAQEQGNSVRTIESIGATIRSLPCQVIDLPDQKITVCIQSNGVQGSRAACGFTQAGLCWSNAVTAPPMAVALPFVKLAKDRGMFRDQGDCEEVARDAGRLTSLLASLGLGNAGSVVGLIAGACGECVCRAAY
jgi:hypothetical protein